MEDKKRTILNLGNSYIEEFKLCEELMLTQKDYNELWDMRPLKFPKIKIFNKEIETPRWFKSYGIGYNFSNSVNKGYEIPLILQKYIDYVNNIEQEYNYNGILVNWYKDGSHYIGKHSDDERQLEKKAPIYCISFGTDRRFIIRNKKDKSKLEFKLENNKVLVMGGECQKYYTHEIPKTQKKIGSRISITIRAFKS